MNRDRAPNPSIERSATGKPVSAAHVKRSEIFGNLPFGPIRCQVTPNRAIQPPAPTASPLVREGCRGEVLPLIRGGTDCLARIIRELVRE